MMRVWTTVIGQRLDSAENTRSMLICAELLKRGHDVVMWTSAYDHIRKEWRKEWIESQGKGFWRCNDLEVRFMRGCGYSENVSLRRFVDHLLAARDFLRQAPSLPQPDVILASIPDHITSSAAISYCKSKGIPAIIDVRDKWPDIFADYITNPVLAKFAKLILSRESRRAARALREADAVVAMMQSMMTWGLSKAGRIPTWRERIFYLTTSPKNFDVQHPDLPSDNKVHRALQSIQGKIVFTFVGTFNRTQHPLLILDAIDHLKKMNKNDETRFAFLIAGQGLDSNEVGRRSAHHANVDYLGWVDTREMSLLLSRSDVGLLAMNFPSPAFNNKAFSYLASGLPIINGATGDLAEIISAERIGINVRAGDAEALANAILALADDEHLRRGMAGNVRRLFDQRFNREINYRAYADHIERIAGDGKKTERIQ